LAIAHSFLLDVASVLAVIMVNKMSTAWFPADHYQYFGLIFLLCYVVAKRGTIYDQSCTSST